MSDTHQAETWGPDLHDQDHRPPIQRVGRRGLLTAGTFRIVLDEVRLPTGEKVDYAFVKRGDTVVIIPQNEAGRIGIFRQYIYPTRSWIWKFPGGGCDCRLPDTVVIDPNRPAEEQQEAFQQNQRVEGLSKPHAASELQQEAGLVAGRFIYVQNYLPDPSLSAERCHILVAQGLSRTETALDQMEFITQLRWFTQDEVFERIRTGIFKHGKLITPFLMALHCGALSKIE